MIKLFCGSILLSSVILFANGATWISHSFAWEDFPPPCSSQIYCYGDLLDVVQMSRIFVDSKTFVDMKLKKPPAETLEIFEEWYNSHNRDPNTTQVAAWVKENFEEPGSEFELWEPTDWNEHPKFLDSIEDISYRQWANDLNHFWLQLGRKMKADVHTNSDLYSIIPVDHPVIVPGGRFREFYYWDSYWIVRGLLLSEMYTTVKGMLENFLSIIDRFEFIPNGGRIYYEERSQPPLLTAMIKTYVDETKDTEFAIRSLDLLEREFQFWMNNHTVVVNGHKLAFYGDQSRGPRPESYREDVESADIFTTEEDKQEHYSELKAAAESGMDFSSRWFINNGTNQGNLTDLKTRSIIAVELNAILFWNAQMIAEFYKLKGDPAKTLEYELEAEKLLAGIDAVLYHEDVGAWLDYDLINNKRRDFFVPTNLSPLWMKCYRETDSRNIAENVLKYINRTGIDRYPGGVPNSLENTGEQWDFPNVWPPMQYMVIMGLDKLGDERTTEMALSWADRWVKSNFIAYKDSQAMFEKYNAEEPGAHGGGGEYDTQVGFGWTNGVIMDLLNKYGSQITSGSELHK